MIDGHNTFLFLASLNTRDNRSGWPESAALGLPLKSERWLQLWLGNRMNRQTKSRGHHFLDDVGFPVPRPVNGLLTFHRDPCILLEPVRLAQSERQLFRRLRRTLQLPLVL